MLMMCPDVQRLLWLYTFSVQKRNFHNFYSVQIYLLKKVRFKTYPKGPREQPLTRLILWIVLIIIPQMLLPLSVFSSLSFPFILNENGVSWLLAPANGSLGRTSYSCSDRHRAALIAWSDFLCNLMCTCFFTLSPDSRYSSYKRPYLHHPLCFSRRKVIRVNAPMSENLKLHRYRWLRLEGSSKVLLT